jgi:hypothetical protein
MLAALAAFARSASSQMIIGSEPPSSSVTRLEPLAARAATCSPTGVEPVKATLRTSGWVTSASPVTAPVGAAVAMGVMAGAILSHLTFLGIEVKGDGGLLFGLALFVLLSSAVVLTLRRTQVPLVGRYFELA